MTLQSSGTIRWSDIRNEFGANISGGGVSLGRYRNSDPNFGNENVGSLTDLPLDIGVPKSGTIKASDFYSKRLNMVLDMYSGGTETRVNCRTRYNDSSKVKVVGQYKARPGSTDNTRVIVNINKTFGSESGSTNRVAVRTGGWGSNCDLEFEIGSNGKIYGKGGDGGNGGGPTSGGGNGSDGSSGLGIEYSCTINNLGRIQAGYGGGGGGAGVRYWIRSGKKSGGWHGSTGGGGGGGAGVPSSSGGDSPGGAYGSGSNGSDGGNGSDINSGNGGAGGNSAGSGGAGAVVNNSSTSGSSGGSTGNGSGGSGGANGYAIITTQGSLPSISGNAVVGRTQTSGSFS